MHPSSMRKEYKSRLLLEQDVDHDPMVQFQHWFQEALASDVLEANAMVLSTVSSPAHRPSARVVLLKEIEPEGFVFFTHYTSKKGIDLEQNPYASLTFFWPELERQVRIEGIVEKISTKNSEEYFYSRPKESRIGAWASAQSSKISDRHVLDEKFQFFSARFREGEVPKPPHWGGYLLKPDYLEFWQGRPSRLHDRIAYAKEGKNWQLFRLAP